MKEGWKEYKLGDVVTPIKERVDASVLSNTSYISTENMLPNKAGITKSSGVPAGYAIKFSPGDILISNIRPYFKKIWRADIEGGCSGDVICLKATKNVDPIYLYYILSQDRFFDYVMSGSKGTKMPRGDRDHIMNWELSLPPLPTQQKIVAILSSLDDKIEVNRRINENLEQQAQALFKSWFVDFEPFGGVMPEDWKEGSLSSVAEYRNGLAMQKYRPEEGEEGLHVLKIKELGQGSFDTNSEFCSPSKIGEKFIIKDGDIIFSWSGTLMVKIWCGGLCGLNQHLFLVLPENYPKWFVYLWTKQHLDNFIRIAQDKAVTMGHIKRGELDKAKVLLPSKTDLKELDVIMAPIHEQIVNNEIESRHLAELRDTLLPKLMKGEIAL